MPYDRHPKQTLREIKMKWIGLAIFLFLCLWLPISFGYFTRVEWRWPANGNADVALWGGSDFACIGGRYQDKWASFGIARDFKLDFSRSMDGSTSYVFAGFVRLAYQRAAAAAQS
jgi:hypothetical protein